MHLILCKKCENAVSSNNFRIKPNGRYHSYCNNCLNKYNKEYSNRRRKEDPKYRQMLIDAKKKYNCSEKGSKKIKEYREQKRKEPEYKESEKIYGRNYYYKNKEKRLKNARLWVKQNKDRAKELAKKHYKKRKKNPVNCFSDRIRGSFRRVLSSNNIKKCNPTFYLLGFSSEDLYAHLCNFISRPCQICGQIIVAKNCHIDHTTPLCTAKSFDDIIKLNQLNNLRLICATCNLKKGKKLGYEQTRNSDCPDTKNNPS